MSATLTRALLFPVLIAAGGATVLAHDMWIEPTSYAPAIGRSIGLRLRIGQDFMGDPLPRDPALIEKFVMVDAEGEKAVVGRDGADPAGLLRLTAPGLVVVGYHSRPSPVVLTSQEFNRYLAEEGLESIVSLRSRKGETDAAARELFVRCAKSLLLAGPAAASQTDRVLGLPLELVAERNPYVVKANERLPVRIIFRNQPIAGVLVMALNRRDPMARASARSDKAGRVQLRLSEPGPWLIKAVHMIPAPAGMERQWDSFWASLTFELGDDVSRGVSSSGE